MMREDRDRRNMKMVFSALLLLVLACTAALADVKADFYVATNGNDAWSGRLPAPNAARTDGPFATPDRARLAAGSETHPTIVRIRGGVYYLQDTLVFTSEDSNTTYAAYPGETPVISGGRRLTGWKTDSRGWWHLTIPEVKSGQWNFISLYVNGERRYRPRLPRQGCYRIAGSIPLAPDEKPSGFEFAGQDIRPDWANLGDVEVLTTHLWNMSRMRIKSVEPSGVVRFTGTTSHNAEFGWFHPGQPYFVENVKGALGGPGEWYLDRPTGELVYVPMKGETPKNCTVIAPRLDQIARLDCDWKNGRYVSNITFKGLTFAHSNWCTPPEGHHFAQSDAVVISAIIVNGARNCRFDGCTITHTGAYAIQLDNACNFNAIQDCELTDLGAGGIKIGFWAEDDSTSHNAVRNNLIAHGGRILPAGTGILVGTSHHNVIEHNDIFDLYYIGISLGFNWDYGTTAHHNLVQDNHIRDIGQGFLSDMGAIYTLGRSPGTVIRHNLIHDVRSQVYGGWGIYLDAASSEITVEDNIVYRTGEGALHHNRGRDNRVVNNIFALGDESELCRSGYENGPSFDFERNIVYWKDGVLLGRSWSDGNYRMDRNLYWNAQGPVEFNGLSSTAWQKTQDAHSLIADPLFADPDAGDFRLSPESPALKLGFKPISMTGFGRERRSPDKPTVAPMAFPDLSKPQHVRYDYEDALVGKHPPFAEIEEENDSAVIRVTDETSASGRRSLKFTDDGKQQQPWHPFLRYGYKCASGRLRVGFAVKIEPGGHLTHEWRDFENPDKPGPSIVIESGKLYANGQFLESMPMDRWVTLEIDCRIGPGLTTYSVKTRVQGSRKWSVFNDLKHSPEFHRLMSLYFIADGQEPGAFYIDRLSISPGR